MQRQKAEKKHQRKSKNAAAGYEEDSDTYLDSILRLLWRFAIIKTCMPQPLERSGASGAMSS